MSEGSSEFSRALCIKYQGVYLSGEDNPKRGIHSESKTPQLARGQVLKCLKSLGYDPKPVELFLGKVKRG